MRVFILCTGRSGSVTVYRACKHITNYTCGHESLASEPVRRLDYPDNHIEADNRLSWFLGGLNEKFGQEAFYIHLIRNKELTVNSFMRRWSSRGSVISSFAEGFLKSPLEKLGLSERQKISELYYDTVNSNITHFLSDKPHKMTIPLENIKEEFVKLWKEIKAEGDLEAALNELDIEHNSSATLNSGVLYNLKLRWLGLFGTLKK